MTLRSNFGSHTIVKRVFAYDPEEGKALVLWRDQWNGDQEGIGEVSVSDLEAIDLTTTEGRYGDVRAELRKRAGYVLNSQPLRAA